MKEQKKFWNEVYKSIEEKKPQYDLWLDKYANVLEESKDCPIIDLGCGFGNDTLYLKERGYKVDSCDFSEQALLRLNKWIDHLSAKCFDMKDGLPFENNSSRIVISDLSLHYFKWSDTQKIIEEINRVLVSDGSLLCRVNSTNDLNYGAGHGIELEKNFYDIDGKLKRFFDEGQLRKAFINWDIHYLQENQMNRYGNNKIVWEIFVRKNKEKK